MLEQMTAKGMVVGSIPHQVRISPYGSDHSANTVANIHTAYLDFSIVARIRKRCLSERAKNDCRAGTKILYGLEMKGNTVESL